jgi:Ca-activated chloride channel family protein
MLDEFLDVNNWFNIEWFNPETLRSFDWEYPVWLYLIPLVPFLLALRLLLYYRFRQKLPSAFPNDQLKWQFSSLLRYIPPVLMILVMTLLLTALARPQKTNEEVEQWSEGIDIMLIIDISQSMQIEDFSPNRLEAAKEVARKFIKGRFQDRIGLVIFSGDAYSLAPLTTDYNLLFTYIDDINFENIENRGTAIGCALAVATNRMRESDSKSKVMI